jgi:wyosine [tRNA(Phe)-imidazoG37] synthetase (radical SAM superfamily)
MGTERQVFLDPNELFEETKERLSVLRKQGEAVDYLTIVPDGEPTLDLNLGKLIMLLKSLDVPVAVISNGSLISRQDVQDELLEADWVSLKLDAASIDMWRAVDRPHRNLNLEEILDGMRLFSERYPHRLMTETMLIEGYNTQEDQLILIAKQLASCKIHTAYISIPTRPPAESYAFPASEDSLMRAYHHFSSAVPSVELITGYEGNAFSATGDSRTDIISITAVHPMREDAVYQLIERNGDDPQVLNQLICDHEILESEYHGNRYYMRNLSLRRRR